MDLSCTHTRMCQDPLHSAHLPSMSAPVREGFGQKSGKGGPCESGVEGVRMGMEGLLGNPFEDSDSEQLGASLDHPPAHPRPRE